MVSPLPLLPSPFLFLLQRESHLAHNHTLGVVLHEHNAREVSRAPSGPRDIRGGFGLHLRDTPLPPQRFRSL